MQILPLFAYTMQTDFSCIGTKVDLESPPPPLPPARVLSVELKVSIHIIGLFDDN